MLATNLSYPNLSRNERRRLTAKQNSRSSADSPRSSARRRRRRRQLSSDARSERRLCLQRLSRDRTPPLWSSAWAMVRHTPLFVFEHPSDQSATGRKITRKFHSAEPAQHLFDFLELKCDVAGRVRVPCPGLLVFCNAFLRAAHSHVCCPQAKHYRGAERCVDPFIGPSSTGSALRSSARRLRAKGPG